MKMLGKAIAIAAKAFEVKTDRGGKPYILHCLWVMNATGGDDEDVLCAAVLHDLVEDCPEWTIKRLLDEGFSQRTVDIINILTHRKADQSYDDYIKGIALDTDCTRIKKKDLEHNSSITRLKGLGKKDFDRAEKYHRAYTYLSRI